MKNNYRLVIAASLFLGMIFLASFAIAENDNESEDGAYVSPVSEISNPVIQPVATITPVAEISSPVVQPVATIVPSISNSVALIDTDGDGVIDSLDKHPGEDDFAFNVTDENNNGVIDELEYLLNL